MRSRPRLERVRVTKVGVGFIGLALVVGLAAVNTGNNALYMVEAMLLAVLVVSGLSSRRNLKGLAIGVRAPAEVYANQPFSLRYRLRNRDRWAAKRWLRLFAGRHGGSSLVRHVERRGTRRGRLPQMIRRRGRHRIGYVRVASIFPLGLFYKVMRYPVPEELLVYPEIFPMAVEPPKNRGAGIEESTRRPGWGHELLSLRRFRSGDDPRGIHWKQTARTGGLVFMERETDQGRRMSIQLDNGVGRLGSEEEARRFERLVSEAASAAVHHLKAGFDVELVTRDRGVPFAGGRKQQLRILEALALLEAVESVGVPLVSADPSAPRLRLGFESPRRATA